jgi:hypothetical protein
MPYDFSALAYTFHAFTDTEFSTKLTKSSLKGSKIPWELQLERYLLPVPIL